MWLLLLLLLLLRGLHLQRRTRRLGLCGHWVVRCEGMIGLGTIVVSLGAVEALRHGYGEARLGIFVEEGSAHVGRASARMVVVSTRVGRARGQVTGSLSSCCTCG